MTPIPTSTLGQLLFTTVPQVNFARIVGDLDSALVAATQAQWALSWDHDDVATFDLDGVRILLGLAENLPGPWPACLTVSVGDGPRPGACPLSQRQTALARMIADRIAARLHPQEVKWHSLQAVADAALVDDLLDLLMAEAPVQAEPVAPEPEAELPPEPQAAPTAEPARFPDVDSGLLPETLARVDAALEARARQQAEAEADVSDPTAQPALVGRAVRRAAAILSANRPPRPVPQAAQTVANDLPDLPHPDLAEAAAIRAALYDPLPGDEAQRPTVQLRLAAHAMNATLMVVALPVGASLMTYSLLRGENLRLSARAMALIGAAIGVLQAPIGEALLPHI